VCAELLTGRKQRGQHRAKLLVHSGMMTSPNRGHTKHNRYVYYYYSYYNYCHCILVALQIAYILIAVTASDSCCERAGWHKRMLCIECETPANKAHSTLCASLLRIRKRHFACSALLRSSILACCWSSPLLRSTAVRIYVCVLCITGCP
jgi:hypothetical protein